MFLENSEKEKKISIGHDEVSKFITYGKQKEEAIKAFRHKPYATLKNKDAHI